MPKKPTRPCPGRGPRRSICRNLIHGSERCCSECLLYVKKAMALYDDDRGNSADRGYDAQWRKVRELKLAQDPLCEICESQKIVKTADLVHHIIPIDECPDLRLVMSNLMSVCTEHHEEIHKKKRWGRKG